MMGEPESQWERLGDGGRAEETAESWKDERQWGSQGDKWENRGEDGRARETMGDNGRVSKMLGELERRWESQGDDGKAGETMPVTTGSTNGLKYSESVYQKHG